MVQSGGRYEKLEKKYHEQLATLDEGLPNSHPHNTSKTISHIVRDVECRRRLVLTIHHKMY